MIHFYIFKVRDGNVIYVSTMPDRYSADRRVKELSHAFWSTTPPSRWFY